MPHMDRRDFIGLLERLDDEDDAAVLAAAREVVQRMHESEIGWDDLLVPESVEEPEPDETDEHEDEYDEDDYEDEDEDEDEAELESAAEQASDDEAGAVDSGATAALINRMLREAKLSEETRAELEELKADLEAGDFTDMDDRYVRALHKRLSNER